MKFWKWVTNLVTNAADGTQTESRTLYLDGIIASESWFDDDITPALFRADLNAGSGDITVWINSPGGDCFAAAQIYNMLREYDGKVTIRIDGIAASAASVIAMAGDTVIVSPVSMMMIHNPSTMAWGDHNEMEKAITMLDEVKNSIINAYQVKTGLSKAKLSKLMEDETWMNAKKAVELHFADEISGRGTGADEPEEDEDDPDPDEHDDEIATDSMLFSRRQFVQAVTNKVAAHYHIDPKEPEKPAPAFKAADYYDRLKSIKEKF